LFPALRLKNKSGQMQHKPGQDKADEPNYQQPEGAKYRCRLVRRVNQDSQHHYFSFLV
jgi:hypothetical protein